MLIYTDLLSGDEMLSDSFDVKEQEFFYEWQTIGDVDVDIGANPSAEDAEEGQDSSARKVIDIIESFRLVEQSGYDKKTFMGYIKPWLDKVLKQLPEDQQAEFKTKAQPAIKFLVGKIKDLQFFTGESMDPEATMAYAYYAEGASTPTFLFPKYALKEQKC
eukprot:jgi/Astpho2/902/Aster-x0975